MGYTEVFEYREYVNTGAIYRTYNSSDCTDPEPTMEETGYKEPEDMESTVEEPPSADDFEMKL